MGHDTMELSIPNSLKEKMLSGGVGYTLSVKMVRTVELPMIAKTAGFDGILIDMEHSSFDLDTTSQLCIAALYAGIAPIVRSPSKDPFYVSRILDGGAIGVIVPHIKTVQDARDVVEAAKFHPLGKRSATSGLPHLQYRHVPAKIANPLCNAATLVIPMIETMEALELVDEIAAVPGVDSLLIGTNDLTAEMGIPGEYDNPRLDDAYAKVAAACRKHNVFLGCGGLHSRLDLVEKYCEMGVNWVMAATDAPLLIAGATKRASDMAQLNERVARSRKSNGHTKQTNGITNGATNGATTGTYALTMLNAVGTLGASRFPSNMHEQIWNTHVHVFEPARFPYAEVRTYTPAPATVEKLLQSSNASNYLIVQASVEDGPEAVLAHVQDLRHARPTGIFRAEIVYEDADESHGWSEEHLKMLHASGVRCLRVRNPQASSNNTDVNVELRNLLKDRMRSIARSTGWAIAMQLPLSTWASLADFLQEDMRGITIIAEHCGSITVPLTGSDGKAFDTLIDLVRKQVLFVKLGALHRRIKAGGTMEELSAHLRTLTDAGPEQLLWGSDWPHVDSTPRGTVESPHLVVDAQAELQALATWFPVKILEAMLIRTPERLFGESVPGIGFGRGPMRESVAAA
ncbi:hypothetical protein LTR15_001783 [Elasticomyces elasticus]|nr:hypothetical protein LTR15_001783 [Elasticomyces elasticus]